MTYWTKTVDEEPSNHGAKVEVMFEDTSKKEGEVSIAGGGSVFLLKEADGKLWRVTDDEPVFWRYIE